MTSKFRSTVAAIVLLLLACSMVSAAESGTLRLEAYVPNLVEITVTANRDVGLLNLTQKAVNITVGSVQEVANSQTGYSVEVSSLGAVGTGKPFLIPEDPTNMTGLEYTIYYDGVEIVFDTEGKATVTNSTTEVSAGISKTVSISYDGTAVELESGYYTDTLTFSIAPK